MIEQRYKKPLIVAIAIHVIALFALIYNFAATQFRAPPASAPTNVIQASAIILSSADSDKTPKLQPKPTPPKPVVDTQKVAEEKAAQAAKEKLVMIESEKAKLQAEKAKALKKKKADAQKKLAQEKKALATKEALLKKQQLIADQKAIDAEKQKKLLAEQKKLQQALMQQQLSADMKNISAIQSKAQTGEIDKYKAEILATIQSNWRIPEINNKLKCIYSVSIAPDGSVLSLQLVQSSGNTELDNSAKQAIDASSPLPVPTDPSLFSHFRQLMLTLSPQGYLQSVGNS